jgi:hypothetical protein
MGHADASSPAAPATAPYKPSFRFGYVNEDEQWCTYRWEAAEKFHEGEVTCRPRSLMTSA